MRAVRCSSGPRLPGWAAAHGPALLHEWRRARPSSQAARRAGKRPRRRRPAAEGGPTFTLSWRLAWTSPRPRMPVQARLRGFPGIWRSRHVPWPHPRRICRHPPCSLPELVFSVLVFRPRSRAVHSGESSAACSFMHGPSFPSPGFSPGQNFSRSLLQACPMPGMSCAMRAGEAMASVPITAA